nr:glutathione peroxidase [Anaerotignum neopropionicum]
MKDKCGKSVAMKDYKGKIVLVVNTATRCGLTPQYASLEELYNKYKEKGFGILDFPYNQFLNRVPGTDEEISEFCSLNYGTTFPRFSIVNVNGKNASPLYVWLKEQAPEDCGNEETKAFEEKVKSFTLGNEASDIKWNFGNF